VIGVLVKKRILGAVVSIFVAGVAVAGVAGAAGAGATTPATSPAPVASVAMLTHPTTPKPLPTCDACGQVIQPQGHCGCSR
jgi:hypothetical protein